MKRLIFSVALILIFVNVQQAQAETFLVGSGTVSAATGGGVDNIDTKDLFGSATLGFMSSLSAARQQYVSTEYQRVTLFGQANKHNLAGSFHEYFYAGNSWDLGIHAGAQFELGENANTNLQFGVSGKRALNRSDKWFGEVGVTMTNIVDETDYTTLFGKLLFRLE